MKMNAAWIIRIILARDINQDYSNHRITKMKTAIRSAHVIEGNLYSTVGEGCETISFSCAVRVETYEGKILQHTLFVAEGHCFNEDGFSVAVNSREAAQRFADRVSAQGFIESSLWELVLEEPSLQERWHDEYLQEVRDERGGVFC